MIKGTLHLFKVTFNNGTGWWLVALDFKDAITHAVDEAEAKRLEVVKVEQETIGVDVTPPAADKVGGMYV